MSKKNNKIAVNQWEKVISSPEKETIDISKGDNKITVEISKNVSNQELAEFEASVIASCFDDDGYFIPYASRIGFDIQLVNYFTNIDCGKNLNKIESLIQTTNLIPAIYEFVGDKVIGGMMEDIDSGLEWEKERRSRSLKADALYDAAVLLLDKLGGLIDKSSENIDTEKTDALIDGLKSLSNKDEEEIARQFVRIRQPGDGKEIL